jgi:hypothetical protein
MHLAWHQTCSNCQSQLPLLDLAPLLLLLLLDLAMWCMCLS